MTNSPELAVEFSESHDRTIWRQNFGGAQADPNTYIFLSQQITFFLRGNKRHEQGIGLLNEIIRQSLSNYEVLLLERKKRRV